jgi:hypothetical protein
MLFNLTADPHELHDLAPTAPPELARGRALLAAWREEMLRRSRTGIDPMDTVLGEGGSLHARECGGYLDRLRITGRGDLAARLARKHGVR